MHSLLSIFTSPIHSIRDTGQLILGPQPYLLGDMCATVGGLLALSVDMHTAWEQEELWHSAAASHSTEPVPLFFSTAQAPGCALPSHAPTVPSATVV